MEPSEEKKAEEREETPQPEEPTDEPSTHSGDEKETHNSDIQRQDEIEISDHTQHGDEAELTEHQQQRTVSQEQQTVPSKPESTTQNGQRPTSKLYSAFLFLQGGMAVAAGIATYLMPIDTFSSLFPGDRISTRQEKSLMQLLGVSGVSVGLMWCCGSLFFGPEARRTLQFLGLLVTPMTALVAHQADARTPEGFSIGSTALFGFFALWNPDKRKAVKYQQQSKHK